VDGLPSGANATIELLNRCGYKVNLIEAGCCGMAGTFGYEAEHYQLSQQIGALKLFPHIKDHPEALIASTGAACRMQIEQGTGRTAQHPIVLAARAVCGE
jgi:Fe-S oxidoreductase